MDSCSRSPSPPLEVAGDRLPKAGFDDSIFINPPGPAQGLHCPVCLLVLRDPYLLSCCGNHICQVCLQPVQSKRLQCPCCRTETYQAMLNKEKRRKVLELRVYCSNKHYGCDWTGELWDKQRHLNDRCEFVEEVCQYGCGQRYIRFLLEVHQRDVCVNRPVDVKLESFMRVTTEKMMALDKEIAMLRARLTKSEAKEQLLSQQIMELQERKEVSQFEIIQENIYFEIGMWYFFNSPAGNAKWLIIKQEIWRKASVEAYKIDNLEQHGFIRVRGERRVVANVKEIIAELVSSVTTSFLTFSSRDIFLHFAKTRGIWSPFTAIGEKFQVNITLKLTGRPLLDHDDIGSTGNHLQEKDEMKTFCVAHTKNEQRVSVIVSDITLFDKAEVIVSPADKDLIPCGDIARSIADRGGPVITQDAQRYISQSSPPLTAGAAVLFPCVGNLPPSYNAIVHVVIDDNPVFSNRKNITLLQNTVQNGLVASQNYISIAIPWAIGCHLHNVPPSAVANALVSEVSRCLERDPDCKKFRDISFVIPNNDDQKIVLSAMHAAMQAVFTDIETFDNLPTSVYEQSGLEKVVFTLPCGTQFQLVHNDISYESVDVIVNTTNTDLQLLSSTSGGGGGGGVAGPNFHAACDALRKQGIKAVEGKVVETLCEGMAQLRCKNIFHIVLDGRDERKLTRMVRACLERAEKLRYSSIAFLPVWSEQSAYPLSTAVKCFMEELKQFTMRRKQQTSSVKTVNMVILHRSMFQQFKEAFIRDNTGFDGGSQDVNGAGLEPTSPIYEDPSDSMVQQSDDDSEVEFAIYGYDKQAVRNAENQLRIVLDELTNYCYVSK